MLKVSSIPSIGNMLEAKHMLRTRGQWPSFATQLQNRIHWPARSGYYTAGVISSGSLILISRFQWENMWSAYVDRRLSLPITKKKTKKITCSSYLPPAANKRPAHVLKWEVNRKTFFAICSRQLYALKHGILIRIVFVEYELSSEMHPFLAIAGCGHFANFCRLKMTSQFLRAQLTTDHGSPVFWSWNKMNVNSV